MGLAEGVANYALTELRWLKDSFIPSEVEENPSTHFIRSGLIQKASPRRVLPEGFSLKGKRRGWDSNPRPDLHRETVFKTVTMNHSDTPP